MRIFEGGKPDEVAKKAGDTLNSVLEKYKDLPILLLLSGGSSFDILQYINPDLCDESVTVGVLDERFSPDPKINNFAILKATPFFQICTEAGTKFIDTSIPKGEELPEATMKYDTALREWVANNPTGKVIAIMGIGLDGHTAGIMPYPDNPSLFQRLFEDPDTWVTGYDATSDRNEHPLRITTTLSFIRINVSVAIVYVIGNKKKEPLKRTIAKSGNILTTPARVIHDIKHVAVCTNINM